MTICNVHQRQFTAEPARLGDLLDHVAESNNALWPSPAWPPLQLDGPLATGTTGGHGMIRYKVEDFEPGRRVVFRFDPSMSLVGTHTLAVLPGSAPRSAILRHEIRARATGSGTVDLAAGHPLAARRPP